VFDCEALRILSHANLWISEIMADVTNFLCRLKDWASCWAVMHWFLQDGNSTLQHLRAYSCAIMTLAKHIMELCFSCFRSCHSLCPVTSRNLYNFVQKFWELQVCVTKNLTYMALLLAKKKMGHYFLGNLHTVLVLKILSIEIALMWDFELSLWCNWVLCFSEMLHHVSPKHCSQISNQHGIIC